MQQLNIELTKNEAIVLFEFLSNLDKNTIKYSDSSEEIVLNNILTTLEKSLSEPFDLDYKDILLRAQNSIK